MNDQSPPKRVTRARAAAKTDTTTKTAIVTAASKAKLTRSASTTKRKTRADDLQDDELQTQPEPIIEPEPKTTRGRPKKTTQPEPEMVEEAPAPKPTRGRPKKIVEAPAPEPVRVTRGRAKKVDVAEEEPAPAPEPAKRPTRGRAVTVTKSAVPKKSVKFEEPDKENIMPITSKDIKAKVSDNATGLRAKPIRKPAAAPVRSTRGRAKTVSEDNAEKLSPLSPKKATQIATANAREATSDDELATVEKTPMKPLMKSPVKVPGSIHGTAKKLDFSNNLPVNRATTSLAQDLKSSVLASPARRPQQSPLRETLKTSPQRANLGGSMMQQSPFKLSVSTAPKVTSANSPFKASLLASPARRPQSPIKVTEAGSPARSNSTFAATPKASTFKISRFETPRTLTKSVSRAGLMLPPPKPANISTGSPKSSQELTDDTMAIEPSMSFSGRLSSIMPREVDPTCVPPEPIKEETVGEEMLAPAEPQDVTMSEEQPDTIVVDKVIEDESTTPEASPVHQSDSAPNLPTAFSLREVDENPFQDSDSEDELASDGPDYSPVPLSGFRIKSPDFVSSPNAPAPFTALPKTPKTGNQQSSAPRSERKQQIGFTPLARQLSDWMAASPAKSEMSRLEHYQATSSDELVRVPSPVKNTFFDDEMSVRDDLIVAPEPESAEPNILENFDSIEPDEEDLDLAHEADEMSLVEPDQIEIPAQDMFEADEPLDVDQPREQEEHMRYDEIASSEASQEYGDENAILVDPALLNLPVTEALVLETAKYATPARVLSERVFHTVCKVPLKPAADDTPMRPSPKKRSASISRLPVQRPTNTLSRSCTVISYSPQKSASRPQSRQSNVGFNMQVDPATPSKSAEPDWSTMGTPARTPRRDLNTSLLKGAVVYVDVHTSEGADASVLFTELLTQMGARCVKTWAWNGRGEDGSKIGITHVVFKDGGKRTLEKTREANGVVSCVGVGWVLDCERENKWLDESLYAVDTAMVPRGGHKRRKSMEPRALANLNGTLVSSSTPSRKSYGNLSPSKEFLSFPDTPVTNKSRRRESVQWVHSPSSSSPNEDNADDQTLMLSPVPATPAPETISAYGEDGLYGDETPGSQTPYFLHDEQLVQQTAPVRKFVDGPQMGAGLLAEQKDESVMMRLMAARRKSLQWAPKVGSPLARGSLF